MIQIHETRIITEEKEKRIKAIEHLNAAIRAVEESGLKVMQDTDVNGRKWYSPVGYAEYNDKAGAVLLLPF